MAYPTRHAGFVRSMSLAAAGLVLGVGAGTAAGNPIQVGFLWHMHQPIYFPGEDVIQTHNAGHFSFSLFDVHNTRLGPYRNWPATAVGMMNELPHAGAQVSFSGSLIENLNTLQAGGIGGGVWNNWTQDYSNSRNTFTSLGNRRMDLVAFGHHHPLMPLITDLDIRMQIRLHRHMYEQTWANGGDYARGIFPPETAFHTRMIPALVAEGLEWVIVDNIHFDRACMNYPHTNAAEILPPNRADQVNPDPESNGGAWVQLNNLWAPSKVSAPFGYQPHWVKHVDPETGEITRIVAVPGARYEGNEDARGGYGAFLYEQVMNAYLQYNTDAERPMFVVLHHDGDNFGGGSEAYYNSNFANFVNWVSNTPNYDTTTINDYLDRFPVPENAVIHVAPGSWAGADGGDPQFRKWLGAPDASGVSPDINSWAALIAAMNRVHTAEAIAPAQSMPNILNGSGSATEVAWHFLLNAQASDYWYWDGTEVWDSNVTRGANLAVASANAVIAGQADTTPPTMLLPQRIPYNPGALEWGPTPMPSDFTVWTLVDDVSGVSSATLYWRVDVDGFNPLDSIENETFAGGSEVGAWQTIPMNASAVPTPTGVLAASVKAKRYEAEIAGQSDVLIDYFVEVVDAQGNIARSDIQHVWVGNGTIGGGGPGNDRVEIAPDPAVAGEPVLVAYDASGGPLAGEPAIFAHVGFNDWSTVVPDVALSFNGATDAWEALVGVPSDAANISLAFNNGAGVWDNNNGNDWFFDVVGAEPPAFVLDGVLDQAATIVATNGGMFLAAATQGETLYLATPDARNGNDHFVYLTAAPGPMVPANWAKSGQIAQWSAFMADEHDNDFAGWFDAVSGQLATGAPGGVLEGTIDLAQQFPGGVPSTIHLAFGAYGTADGGNLRPMLQVPASVNADGNIDAVEYITIDLGSIAVGGGGAPCPADLNGDGIVDTQDLGQLLAAFGQSDAGDVNRDGVTDSSDLGTLLGAFGLVCR